MSLNRSRHATYNINYHFVWCVKFRRSVLGEDVGQRLEKLIRKKTTELKGSVIDLTVQPDHVHLFCSFAPTIAPTQIMNRLKGYSAHMLREEFPWLKSRLPNLWTRSYYVGTVGDVSAETVQQHIAAQKGR